MNQPMRTGDCWTQWFMLPGVKIGRYTRADGSSTYWRREAGKEWVKLPHWRHPKTFAYQPWHSRLRHSCGRP